MKKIIITLIIIITTLNSYSQTKNDVVEKYIFALKERSKYDESDMLENLKLHLRNFLFARNAVHQHYKLGDIEQTFRNERKRQKYQNEYDRTLILLKRTEYMVLQEYLSHYNLCKTLLYEWYVLFPIYDLNRGYDLYMFELYNENDYKDLVSYKQWYNESKKRRI